MGMFRMGRDVWRQLDLIIFVLVVSEFVLTSFVSISMDEKQNKWYAIFLQCSFILLVACRTVKTLLVYAVQCLTLRQKVTLFLPCPRRTWHRTASILSTTQSREGIQSRTAHR